MTEKHKWYDVIVAWANGEEIQYRLPGAYNWKTYNKHTYISTGYESSQPDFSDGDYEWRIKPITKIKRYRMALVSIYSGILLKEPMAVAIDVTDYNKQSIELNINGFIKWIGDTVEVEIEE